MECCALGSSLPLGEVDIRAKREYRASVVVGLSSIGDHIMRKFTDIGVEKVGHVGTIEIQRPPLNFFDISLINQIADALEEFDRDIEIRASVLAARGKAFCAGANFNDPARQEQEARAAKGDPADGLGPINHLYVQAVRIFRNKKPIVAAVHGAAIGGGLGLAVSADFRVTCPEARFAANFTKLGFHPGFGLTTTLPELVGKNNAELIFYTSRRVTGEEATRMGLANVCVPQDQVRAEAMKLAREIAECSPLGLLATRATMRAGLADRVMAATNHELAEQTRLRATEDFKEGIKATEERRVANFRGR
jgi:enoyl-CoA hydratase/carnithine racemase